MKIIILGAGQVGSSVAESLVNEANDITVVDTKQERLLVLQDRLDLRTVNGNASHPSVLVDAGAHDADMILAVTEQDETNLVACKLAASLFNTPTKIARIRSTEYLKHPEIFSDENFSVDYAISPEQILTEYIEKLIEFPEALQVLDFAMGKVSMVAERALQGGALVGQQLQELRKHIPTLKHVLLRSSANIVLLFPKVIRSSKLTMKCFLLPRQITFVRLCVNCVVWIDPLST